jgi:hypothetical protein
MSWSISITGEADAVADAIDKEQYVPAPLKEMVRLMARDAKVNGGPAGLYVESNGHFGGGWSSVQSFRCLASVLASKPEPGPESAASGAAVAPPGEWPPSEAPKSK